MFSRRQKIWSTRKSVPCVVGTPDYRVQITKAASINDLHSADFSVEIQAKLSNLGSTQYLAYKGSPGTSGWRFLVQANGTLYAQVMYDTPQAISSTVVVTDSLYHLLKMTFTVADGKIRIYSDNVLLATSNAVAGSLVSDALVDLIIGRSATGFSGSHNWIRISNAIRSGKLSRFVYPVVDANTKVQFNVREGRGTAFTDFSGNTNNGTLAGTFRWSKD